MEGVGRGETLSRKFTFSHDLNMSDLGERTVRFSFFSKSYKTIFAVVFPYMYGFEINIVRLSLNILCINKVFIIYGQCKSRMFLAVGVAESGSIFYNASVIPEL